jgi:ribosomal subunit interface protein
MELPLTITAHEIELPEDVEAVIREKASRLEKFNGRVIGCHVTVEGPGRHHRNGGPYNVRIDLTVPGTELVVTHKAAPELTAAIREAFDAARRRLDEHRNLKLERRKEAREERSA